MYLTTPPIVCLSTCEWNTNEVEARVVPGRPAAQKEGHKQDRHGTCGVERKGARRRHEASSSEKERKGGFVQKFSFFCLYHSLTAGNIGGWEIPARSRRPSEHTSFTTPFDWMAR